MKKNILPSELLYKDKEGKYLNDAQKVADHFGVARNAVYNSRNRGKRAEKFDKLYAYEKAVEACEKGKLVMKFNSSKYEILDTLHKRLKDGVYSVSLYWNGKEES